METSHLPDEMRKRVEDTFVELEELTKAGLRTPPSTETVYGLA